MCPYRALDQTLLESAIRYLFGVHKPRPILVTPAPTLSKKTVRRELGRSISSGTRGFVFLQDKLGGEISIPATERSPELAFDITVVELIAKSGVFSIGRYGILEAQTMDFHGSYRYAVKNLEDALRLHGEGFHRVLEANPEWLSDHIEGPNIANVFKRTFYQIMLKFQIGTHEPCAGCVLALPAAVWDSWQRHLGKPQLKATSDGTFSLQRPQQPRKANSSRVSAWILVFDTDTSSQESPNPIRLSKVIATDAGSISYYALKVAPEFAATHGGSLIGLQAAIRRRLSVWWPELVAL